MPLALLVILLVDLTMSSHSGYDYMRLAPQQLRSCSAVFLPVARYRMLFKQIHTWLHLHRYGEERIWHPTPLPPPHAVVDALVLSLCRSFSLDIGANAKGLYPHNGFVSPELKVGMNEQGTWPRSSGRAR